MRRSTLLLTLVLTVVTVRAETFRPADLLPEAGVSVLDRDTARRQLDRELFGDPHASVVIGRVDVYGRFPYLEARYFQVVSDPTWNRLLFGQTDRGLDAYDGSTEAIGALRAPRGMATDENGHLYVADSGNDRIVVFSTGHEYDELRLEPLFTIDGLSNPHDVTFSNAGTPFDASDDRVYVADTGRNRVVGFDLESDGAREAVAIGDLGGGEGRFAGPTAITVARENGLDRDVIVVADSHNRRLVRLVDEGSRLHWDGSIAHDLPEVTGLDTDHWGNVYAASPNGGEIRKFAPDLMPVARLSTGVDHPRGVHVPMVTVHDHVRGTRTWSGRGSAVVVERWDDASGLRRVDLGVDLDEMVVADDVARFTLTDRARVSARVLDRATGRELHHSDLGEFDAGRRDVALGDLLAGLPAGNAMVELEAVSTYDDAIRARASSEIELAGDTAIVARHARVLGPSPNPFNPRTAIEFVVPAGSALEATLEIVDARGRVVRRTAARTFTAGRHAFDWNGTDDAGQSVGSGIYLYRVRLGEDSFAGKLALVK